MINIFVVCTSYFCIKLLTQKNILQLQKLTTYTVDVEYLSKAFFTPLLEIFALIHIKLYTTVVIILSTNIHVKWYIFIQLCVLLYLLINGELVFISIPVGIPKRKTS